MNPHRFASILLAVLVLLFGTGTIRALWIHSSGAAKVLCAIDVILISVLGVLHQRFSIRVLMYIPNKVREWRRQKAEGRARLEAEQLEQQRRIAADLSNQEILYLQSRAAPHLMLGLHPVEFEQFVLRYFQVVGYEVQETKVTGDGGIDGVLRLAGRTYLLQCKRYAGNSVGEPPIRDFFGAITKAQAAGGFFVTTSTFTPTAIDFATGTNIELIDGDTLAARIKLIPFTDARDRTVR